MVFLMKLCSFNVDHLVLQPFYKGKSGIIKFTLTLKVDLTQMVCVYCSTVQDREDSKDTKRQV